MGVDTKRARELVASYRDDVASVSHDSRARIILTGAVALETVEILDAHADEVGRLLDVLRERHAEEDALSEKVMRLRGEVGHLSSRNRELIKANAEVANLFVGHETLLAAAKEVDRVADEIVGVEHQRCNEPPCSGCEFDNVTDTLKEAIAACKEK
jgi:hypothetical protein